MDTDTKKLQQVVLQVFAEKSDKLNATFTILSVYILQVAESEKDR